MREYSIVIIRCHAYPGAYVNSATLTSRTLLITFTLLNMLSVALAVPFIPNPKPSIDDPNYEASHFTTSEPQSIILINSGMASLKQRLDMIDSAQRSIDAEFFIYNIDHAGRLFTQALIKKALQGVKVRLLLDYSIPVVQMNKYFTTELQKHRIEVRYYNKNLMVNLYGAQFRSHRKLLVIDGEIPGQQQAITGGRNIADEYFDLNTEYNFRDSDIFIKGSLVKAMHRSFEMFWSSPIVEEAPFIVPPAHLAQRIGYPEQMRFLKTHILESSATTYERETATAKDYVTENNHDKIFLELINNKGLRALEHQPRGICTNTTFIADFPGSSPYRNIVFDSIRSEFARARNKVQIESPYLILKGAGKKLVHDLRDRGVDLQILTNSLNSTDASYTSGALYPRIDSLTSTGAHVWLYTGIYPFDLDPIIPVTKTLKARWGIHSKRAIIDEQTILVGTFNADPRSKNLNAEMAVICRNNPDLGIASSRDFEKRLWQSVELNEEGEPKDGRSLLFGADWKKKMEFYLLEPFSNLFDFLL